MQTTPDRDARRPRLIAVLVLTLTLAVFARVAHQGYVDWDDGLHTYNNPHLATLAGVGWLWRHSYGGLYVPVSYTAYAIVAALAHRKSLVLTPEASLTPLDPRVFHAANLGLHLLNTLLVFLILHRLLRRDWAAGAGALLFGIHPLQVESVAWISELRGLLCGFFSLLAILQCVSLAERDATVRATPGSYALATVTFLLALLCKPSAVTLPLIVLALDYGMVGRSWQRCIPPMLCWLAVSVILILVTRSAQSLSFSPEPLRTRPLVAGDALWFYLCHFFWPARLGPDYGRTPAWVLRHGAWLTAVLPVLLGMLLWRVRPKSPSLVAAMALTAAVLLPVLGLVPFAFQLYSTVADRYIYLALLGPALALGGLLSRCEDVPRWRVPAAITGVALFLMLGVRSFVQVATWDSALSFTGNAIAVNPESWVMHYNRGHYWQLQGDAAAAAAEYGQTIAYHPGMAEAHCNLGVILLQQGREASGETELRTALHFDPTLPQPHVVLGECMAQRGDASGAAAQWAIAVREWPEVAVLRYSLGTALADLGRSQEAVAQFREALRLQPRFALAQVSLTQALRPSGRGGAALPPAHPRT